jgi:hypothetical protein
MHEKIFTPQRRDGELSGVNFDILHQGMEVKLYEIAVFTLRLSGLTT